MKNTKIRPDNTFNLSQSQLNVLSLEERFPEASINNIASTLKIMGRLDLSCLEKAINILLEKNISLRIRITMNEDEPVQYYAEYEEERFAVYDFSQTNRFGASTWQEAVAKERMPLFDAPLCRFYIFKTGEEEGGVIIKTHHIISDGGSQVLIAYALTSLYRDLLEGKETFVGENEDMFPAYSLHVEAEQKYFNSSMYGKDGDYWRKKLEEDFESPSGVKECKSAVISQVGARRTYQLSSVLTHAIESFCREKRVAPFAVIYMALAIYLKRVGGSQKLAIGVPIDNRANFMEKKMTGMMVSTLPFICELDDEKTFSEYNDIVAEEWYNLLRHQRYPYAEIAKINSDLDRGTDLFRVVLSYQEGTLYSEKDMSVTFEGRWHYSGYQAEELVIHMSRFCSEGYVIDYDYLTQIFSEEEIDRMHDYIVRIMMTAIAMPDRPIWQIQMIGVEEREKVLFRFNETGRYVRAGNIWTRFEKAVSENRNRAALIIDGNRMTYEKLKKTAEAISTRITESFESENGEAEGGAEREQKVVAIHLERGPELVAAMLGVARSGNTWVILQKEIPAERMKTIIEDSGASLMICGTDLASPKGGLKLLRIEDIDSDREDIKPAASPSDDDIAYIVYTSGSTGTPKGVEIYSRSLVNFADSMKLMYGYGAVLSMCNTGFDVFMIETLVPLVWGKTVAFVPENCEDAANVAGIIKKYGVGVLVITPSRLRANMRNTEFVSSLKGIESIISGGEHLTGSLVSDVKLVTGARIYNQYGPSETTIGVSWQLVNDAPVITVGRPMQNCRMYVLDDHRQPLPEGVYGDLYIGGMCVGKGYKGRDDLTAECFTENPFEPGDRMYKTGDVACWDSAGQIILAGRRDSQVKLRGLRIEPQEIALTIGQHPAVTATACKITEFSGQKVLVVYYTSDIYVTESELMTFASSYLPGYMLPAAIIRLEEMPLTSSGKTDLKRLPDPELNVSDDETGSVTEQAVLDAFRKTLKRTHLDLDSDYFLFGGDSLRAAEALCSIENETGVKLKVSDLYAHRTARRLASLISKSPVCGTDEADTFVSVIKMAPYSDSYIMTPTQQGIYLQTAADPTGIAYNMPGIFLMDNEIDTERLEAAFKKLISGEEIFRTSFMIEGGKPVAKIAASADFKLETIETKDPAEARSTFVRKFDLSKAPLLRAALWKDEEENAYLFVDMHHIVSDGISTPIIISKLDAAYRGTEGDTSFLSYRDYAYWYENERKLPEEQLEYWKRDLENRPAAIELPVTRIAPRYFDFAGSSVEAEIPGELASRALSFTESRNITMYMLTAAAFAVLMSAVSGSDDIVFGTPVSGRREQETWEMIGPFINTLPLRIKTVKKASVSEYLESVKKQVVDMLDNQDVSPEEIISILPDADTRAVGRNPLYNVLFSYRPLDDTDIVLGGNRLERMDLDAVTSKFDMSFEIFSEGGAYGVRAEYARNYFEREAVELYIRSFMTILNDMISWPEKLIDDIEKTSPQDRIKLIERPNRMTSPYINVPIDEVIDEVSFIDPDAAAVKAKDVTITFRQLKVMTDSMAAQLIENGVEPRDAVGLVCRRNELMVPAMIAILKAGASYVPLLVSYPSNRINYMLETAGVKMIYADELSAEELPDDLIRPSLVMDTAKRSFVSPAGRKMRDAANILFTSGSTGKPKGVILSHEGVANLLSGMTEIMGEGRNTLCTTNIIFDVFITETLISLALGKCVVMADEEEMMLPWKIAEIIRKEKINNFQMTPSRLQMCMGNSDFSSTVGMTDMVIMAGEAIPQTLHDSLKASGIGHIYNLYGPTEATVYVTIGDITETERPTMGSAIKNCRIYVLDDRLRHVMPTAPGELYLAGTCLADGYVNRPDLTAEAYINDPFVPGEKMYKTGDLARLLPNGIFDYIGRRDNQIKLNGQRVEPSEIESCIIDSGEASEAAVIPLKKGAGGVKMTAFIVSVPGCTSDIDAIKKYMKDNLPSYMIPGVFEVLTELPRTPSGKTDRKQLKAFAEEGAVPESLKGDNAVYDNEETEPVISEQSCSGEDEAVKETDPAVGAEGEAAGSAPEDECDVIETAEERYGEEAAQADLGSCAAEEAKPEAKEEASEALAAVMKKIWSNVLGKEDFDRDMSFFDMGGSSLDALSVITEYFAKGWEMSLTSFYENTSFNEQYEIISGMAGAVPAASEEDAAAKDGVLVTGATGYIGAHIVKELIEAGEKNIICLVRGRDESRLYENLEYYFGSEFVDKNRGCISAADGDITLERLGMSEEAYVKLTSSVYQVIHAAADIRHFADPEQSVTTNEKGTANIVSFAEDASSSLLYISTVSVSGDHVKSADGEMITFTEMDSDIGQNWADNVYIKGKFLGEKAVLDAGSRGLDVKICRIGRIVGRASDGKFQKAPENNAFYGLMQALAVFDCLPAEMLNAPVEITSVDECARAIVLLRDGDRRIYHIFNPETVTTGEISRALGYDISEAEPAQFMQHMASALRNAPPGGIAQFIEVWERIKSGRMNVIPSADITVKALEEKGMKWKTPDPAVLLREFPKKEK